MVDRCSILAATAWAVSALLSLIASLCVYCDATSDVPDEYALMLAVVGALGLGFAIGSYAIASALEGIAIGLSLAVAEQLERAAKTG